MNDKFHFSRAFTLIELLIAISIIAILLLAAIPATQHLLLRNRAAAQAHQIMGALNFARTEAIKRGQIVIFCPGTKDKPCAEDWRAGQVIMADNKIVRIYPALNEADNLIWRGSLGKNASLQFDPSGFTHGQSGSFYYCSSDKQYSKRIVIEQSGRARLEDNDGAKC